MGRERGRRTKVDGERENEGPRGSECKGKQEKREREEGERKKCWRKRQRDSERGLEGT